MDKLIDIQSNETLKQAVNARDLHKFLESKQDFSTWMKNRIDQYGFIENQDFIRFHKKMEANNATIIDYYITLDMAKELSMVERNDKGKQARLYFIECEKQVAAFKLPQTFSEALRMLADETEAKEKALVVIEQQKQIIQVKDDLIRVSNEASVKAGEVLIREFVKSQDLITLGEKQFYQWMREQKLVFGENNEPYQQYVHAGYFTYKPTEKMHGGKYRHTLRVTPRGKVWLAAKYMAYLEKVGFEVPESKVRNGLVVIK